MLKVNRGYGFLMWLGSLVFLAFGALVVEYPKNLSDVVTGWAFILFFGLCAIVFALELIAPQISHLELTRDGFRIVQPLRWKPAHAVERDRKDRGLSLPRKTLGARNRTRHSRFAVCVLAQDDPKTVDVWVPRPRTCRADESLSRPRVASG